jgi:uncharacterized protein YcsI (UPF0317 family)
MHKIAERAPLTVNIAVGTTDDDAVVMIIGCGFDSMRNLIEKGICDTWKDECDCVRTTALYSIALWR